MSGVRIPWGRDGTLPLELPPRWNLLGVLEPNAPPPVKDAGAAVREALSRPVDSPPLEEVARGARRAAILVDDLSRPTPADTLLPPVLEHLEAAGVPRPEVTLVMALGTHRAMTRDEVAKKVGRERVDGLRWENHDYASAGNVFLGRTSRDTPVYVNATVARADVVVSLGLIEPHVIAGFGGGYKNLIPGVAGAPTIAATHTLNLTPATFHMTGRPLEENPMRQDLEEGGALLGKPFFLVNTVLDAQGRVVQVVAGHPVAAHRAGAETSARMCGVRIPRAADVAIAGSHPMDLDLRQGLKALANSLHAVRPGGLLIDMVRAEEGVGHMAARHSPRVGRPVFKLLAPLLAEALRRRRSNGQGEEFKFFTYFGLQALRRNDLLVYAPSVPREFARTAPIAEFAWSLEELWAAARRRFPGAADVLVFPSGGMTYPVL